MATILIPVVIVLIALIVAVVVTKQVARGQRTHADRLRHGHDNTVRYQVPEGRDPAAVMLELRRAGYEVVSDASVGQSGELMIAGPHRDSLDREDLRRTLRGITRINMEGDIAPSVPPVIFMDE